MRRHGIGQGGLLLDNAQAALDEILAGLGRARMYAATIVGTAGVGNKAIAQAKNPAASGKSAYFLLGDLWVATAMTIAAVFDGTDNGGATASIPMYDGGAAGVVVVGGSNAAAVTGTAFLTTPSLPINTAYLLPGWFWAALPPGKNLQFQGGTVNQAFTVNLRWIELAT
jgi:hypothetical protein